MKTTIDMAREAGADIGTSGRWLMTQAELYRLDLAVAMEREACAKECKFDRTSADIEIAIRARGNT
jgi:protein-tyrosine-phosphatase